jgi:hypothetical protein
MFDVEDKAARGGFLLSTRLDGVRRRQRPFDLHLPIFIRPRRLHPRRSKGPCQVLHQKAPALSARKLTRPRISLPPCSTRLLKSTTVRTLHRDQDKSTGIIFSSMPFLVKRSWRALARFYCSSPHSPYYRRPAYHLPNRNPSPQPGQRSLVLSSVVQMAVFT